MEKEDVIEKFSEFLREFYYNELISAMSEGRKSITVDFSLLDKFDTELADYLLENPEEALPLAEEATKQIDLPGEPKLRIRFINLPESKQIRIRNIRAEHIGKLIAVDGIVKRASEVRPEVSEAIFQCPECGNKITVIQTERIMKMPAECNCGNRKNFKLIDQKLYDARWIAIEEAPEITTGERPSEIMIFLKEDLTSPRMQNKTDPGNRIKVVGVLKQLQRRIKGTRSRQLEIYIDANSVEAMEVEWEELEITPEDQKKILELAADPNIYNKLVASIAPALYGMDEIKEAIALQLFGGEQHIQKDKSRVRGDIHILLVGDPSTAKSVLMKVVSTLIPRGRYVSGKGVSVDYDDPAIYMENGVIKTDLIGKVIDKFYKGDEEGFVKVSGISVPSFDPDTMKIEWSPVRYVFRHRIKEKMIKMILETGREVKVTSDHSVFVLDNGIVTKKADEIKEGDFLVIPNRIPHNPRPITEIDLKEELEKIPENERKHIKIVDKKYLKSKFSRHKIPIKIKINDKLMRLIGYYIADGWLHEADGSSWKIEFELDAHDKKTIEDIRKIVHAIFKIKANIKKKKDSNSYRVLIDDKIVFLIFKYILKVGTSVETKKIPEIVFNVSPKLQKEFIKALVRGDYGVTGSKMLMSDLLYLFILNGTIASFGKRKKERVIKSPDGHTSYVDRYVFELKSPKPIKILSNVLNNSKLHSIQKLKDSDLGFVQVKKIEIENPSNKYVYDFSVDGKENFIAGFGGVCCHNTGAGLTATVVRDEEFLGGWVLEAGALVMCNKSLIAIDEFEKIEKTDQIALHEAMEQNSYHPSFEIMMADGSRMTIKEIVDRLFEERKSEKIIGKDCEILPVNNLKLITSDFKDTFPINVNRVSRHKAPEYFVQIQFSNGREILVTPEHPIFIIKDARIEKCQAKELKPNQFVPGVKKLTLVDANPALTNTQKVKREKEIKIPSNINPDLAKFLGYFISEGYSYSGSSKEIGLSNTNQIIIDDMRTNVETNFGLFPLDYTQRNRTQRFISSRLFNLLKKNFPNAMQKAREKRIPSQLFVSSEDCRKSFLNAAFIGDGSVETDAVCYRTSSKGLAADYQDLLLSLGIHSRIVKDRSNNSFKVYITGDSLGTFASLIETEKMDPNSKKQFEKLVRRARNSKINHDVLPTDFCKIIMGFMKKLGIPYTGYFNNHIKRGYGITRAVYFRYLQKIMKRLKELEEKIENTENLSELRKSLKWSQQRIANLIGTKRGVIDYCERNGYSLSRRKEIITLIKNEYKKILKGIIDEIDGLKKLEKIRWLKIKKVKLVKNEGNLKTDWVYDVTVEPTHTFVSCGLILHNTISIAKANIVATLPAQTAILAGGNPKLGRFDPYIPIREQIDVPETLLARFDLKFALRDIPNVELDTKVADHILKARHYGEEEIAPAIDADLLKKFVAYARKNCHPKLSREAGETLKEFFVSLREKVTSEEAPVPITLRQYEALIRLAEASAKVQLRNEVTKEDAMRAINLMKASLRQFGFEPETGKLDIDRAEGHVTAAQRSRIRIILDIIEELTASIGKNIPKDEIVKKAREQGLDEFSIEKILDELKKSGVLFEPKPNTYQKI